MCGICGQFNFATGEPVLQEHLERLASTIRHRGPDDEGFYVDRNLGLGFRRLSIIDLGGGHQPMSDPDETVWVVFNGEIYNYEELRAELKSYGHRFRTVSDTEVIVHGYKQWGQDVLNHLNGMFGLAIWDVRSRRLTVARDAFGIKQIYYKIEKGSLCFGSEIRPVLAASDERPDIDITALNLFLRYRFAPSPYTMYQGVRKLAAGTLLTCENGQCTVRRWYNYKPEPFSPAKSTPEVQEELTELYRRAMKRHLLADVPLGLLLSGGMDSALLLALMNLYGDSWRTYTVGYGSSFRDDEMLDAAGTAAMLRSNHAETTLDQAGFGKALPNIVGCLEEPIASSSIVPMYFVCKRARQDVKVALMGQGPDELFGGYRRHLGVRYGEYWRMLPKTLRQPVAAVVNGLPRNETLKRGVYSLEIQERLRRYQHVLSLAPAGKIDGLFAGGLLTPETGDRILDCWEEFAPLSEHTDELGGFQFMELRSTLPDELLMYADKLSMAHGLEVRVPYLDRDVVEYVERLPANLKVRNGSRKWLHRRVSEKFLPAEILKRKKRGFAVNVVDDWFRDAIGSQMDSSMRDSQSLMYRYLSPKGVQELLDGHRSGADDNHKVLFSLVVFEQWLRSGSVVGEQVSAR